MQITRVLNDDRATAVTAASRHESNDMGSAVFKTGFDARGLVVEIGRGTTDPNKTYLALFNTNGTKCYLYPNDAGDGLVVDTVKP